MRSLPLSTSLWNLSDLLLWKLTKNFFQSYHCKLICAVWESNLDGPNNSNYNHKKKMVNWTKLLAQWEKTSNWRYNYVFTFNLAEENNFWDSGIIKSCQDKKLKKKKSYLKRWIMFHQSSRYTIAPVSCSCTVFCKTMAVKTLSMYIIAVFTVFILLIGDRKSQN